VKKEDQDIKLSRYRYNFDEDFIKDSYKTTNINILLNRVRLDKKRFLKKEL
jgi:hypothetical protein